MKRRTWIFAVLIFAALGLAFCFPANCQSINSAVYVRNFPGTTVGQMTANAMVTCVQTPVPCILVLDPSLHSTPAGTMPTLCANCYLVDWRNGPPEGSGGGAVTPQFVPVQGNESAMVNSLLQQALPDNSGTTACDPNVPPSLTGILCYVGTQEGTFMDFMLQIQNRYPLYANNIAGFTWNPTLADGTLTIATNVPMPNLFAAVNKYGGQGVTFFACSGALAPLNVQSNLALQIYGVASMPDASHLVFTTDYGTQFPVGFNPPASGTDATCNMNMGPRVESIDFWDLTGDMNYVCTSHGCRYEPSPAVPPTVNGQDGYSFNDSVGNGPIVWHDMYSDISYFIGDVQPENVTPDTGAVPHTSALVTTYGAGWVGLATAPTGSCVDSTITQTTSRLGAWQVSNDGNLSYCDGTNWHNYASNVAHSTRVNCLSVACSGGSTYVSGTTYTNALSTSVEEEITLTSTGGSCAGSRFLLSSVIGGEAGPLQGISNACDGAASISFQVFPGETFSVTAAQVDGGASEPFSISRWQEVQ